MGLIESIRMLTWCQFLACNVFLLLFGWHSIQADYLAASVYLSGSLVTALLLLSEQSWSKTYYLILRRSIFSVYTLLSLLLLLFAHLQTSQLHLSVHLVYPLLAFSLLPFRIALFFVLVFSVLANLLLMLQLDGAFRAAYITTFWLVTLLTSLHSFTQHLRQEKLQKQLNRDARTQLFNLQQLKLDLPKEQARAEREATDLGVIYLIDDKSFDQNNATKIASHFAPYEGLYLVASNQIIALIPLAEAADLKLREALLLKQLPTLNISAQVSSLEEPTLGHLESCSKQASLLASKAAL